MQSLHWLEGQISSLEPGFSELLGSGCWRRPHLAPGLGFFPQVPFSTSSVYPLAGGGSSLFLLETTWEPRSDFRFLSHQWRGPQVLVTFIGFSEVRRKPPLWEPWEGDSHSSAVPLHLWALNLEPRFWSQLAPVDVPRLSF